LYLPARGRRFVRLPDNIAEAYVGALLARRGALGTLAQRLKGLLAEWPEC